MFCLLLRHLQCGRANNNVPMSVMVMLKEGVSTSRMEPPTANPSPLSPQAATCLRSEETSDSTLEICTLASTKLALMLKLVYKSGWASDAAIDDGRSASDRATDAMNGGGCDSESKPGSTTAVPAWTILCGGPISQLFTDQAVRRLTALSAAGGVSVRNV